MAISSDLKSDVSCSGYMSPEYAFSGTYSVKSDVFSLGVLLLELVSGRRNRILDHLDQHLSLLGHVIKHEAILLPFHLKLNFFTLVT